MTLYDYCIAFEREDLLEQWSQEKNMTVTAEQVTYGSHKRIWWQCGNGHEWEAAIYSRTGKQSAGCPYCERKKPAPDARSLETEWPELASQWHPTKNQGLSPSDVTPSTHRKVWWRCEKGHEWQSQVNSRTNGCGCPVCSNRKIIPGENDLATTHPELKKQWHPDRNGNLTPERVTAGVRRKVWWRCEKGHEWFASIVSRTSGGTSCPVCNGKLIIAGENDLATAFPQLASQWNQEKNKGLTPQAVSPYSNRKVWWCCELGHEWEASVDNRTRLRSGCPYCTGKKVLPGFNDLATKHPKIAAQWHPTLNESLTPQMVTPGSNKKAWWQCQDGHVWKAMIFSRTGARKSGCPVCAGKVKEKPTL